MLYNIADVIFDITPKFSYSINMFKPFEVFSGDVSLKVEYTDSDILDTKKLFNVTDDAYTENLLIFKIIAEYITNYKNGLLYHSSAFSYKQNGVLIAADSGTGKSTHSSFWRSLYGKDVVMVNDDKPFIRLVDGKYYIYGSPWMGKHNLGSNTRCELKCVCLLRRSNENRVEKIDKGESFGEFIGHALRLTSAEGIEKVLTFCQGLVDSCSFYKLYATFDISSAKICHDVLFGDL